MPFSWAQGSIAGVSLTDLGGDPSQCFILDGAKTLTTRFVNNKIASDGSVNTQGFNNNGRAQQFGVKLSNIRVDKLKAIIDAINNSIDNNDSFAVVLQDDFHNIDKQCKIDGSDWLSYPDQITNEDFFAEVTMKFITTGG